MKVLFRKIHRWLGLLMVLQISAWMFSGFYFALYPIETIRGEHLAAEPEPWQAADLEGLVDVGAAWSAVAGSSEVDAPGEIKLIRQAGKSWYRFTFESRDGMTARLVNARTGERATMLDAAAAVQAANRSLAITPDGPRAELVDQAIEGSEFRGRALPLWRVSYRAPEDLNVYVDAWTGEVVARRTDRWRLFDFLWMLHIMDFDERDDFNTPLLQISALLGLILALTGLVYWMMTTRIFRRSR